MLHSLCDTKLNVKVGLELKSGAEMQIFNYVYSHIYVQTFIINQISTINFQLQHVYLCY